MRFDILILAHKLLGLSAVLVSAGLFTAIDFTRTVTLGSVLIIIAGSAIALIFTARSKVARVWRDERDGERAAKERAQEELSEERIGRITFEKEQQLLRHDLKNKLAEVNASLRVMEAKTDLTAALDTISKMNERTTEALVAAMHGTSRLSEERDASTHKLLTEIRDKLPSEPVSITDE